MLPVTVAAVGLALVLDLLVAEFPERIHPVTLFGRLIAPFDRSWTSPRLVGICLAVGFPILAAGLGAGLTVLAVWSSPVAGTIVAGVALFSTTSLRMLLEAAHEVIILSDTEPDRAREAVRALVGRDPESLSAGELRSAAVESAAENLADGLVAPLFAFALGAQISLTVAVAAAVWVKAVNTLDSMLGYRSKPVGWASARLDDLVMWVPARLSALLIAVAARDPVSMRRARSWAREPSSPNSGWPMATLAETSQVQLSKPGAYTLNRDAEFPSTSQAHSCVRVVGFAGLIAFVATGVVTWS